MSKRVILQYTLSGGFVKEWDKIKEAASAVCVDLSCLYKHVKGETKSCGGFFWKYAKLGWLKDKYPQEKILLPKTNRDTQIRKNNLKKSIQKYNENNKDKIKIQRHNWYLKNKEKAYERSISWQRRNPHKLKTIRKNVYNRTKNKINEKRRRQYATDPSKRLKRVLSSFTRGVFKNNGWKKTSKTASILGCSYEEARKHIEEQFLPGMTWENAGLNGWEIDHIIPVSFAKSADDLSHLCNIVNLRPLWWYDNLKKRDSAPENIFLQ